MVYAALIQTEAGKDLLLFLVAGLNLALAKAGANVSYFYPLNPEQWDARKRGEIMTSLYTIVRGGATDTNKYFQAIKNS